MRIKWAGMLRKRQFLPKNSQGGFALQCTLTVHLLRLSIFLLKSDDVVCDFYTDFIFFWVHLEERKAFPTMQRWKCVLFLLLLNLCIEFFLIYMCAAEQQKLPNLVAEETSHIPSLLHSANTGASCACPCIRKIMWAIHPWSLSSCGSQSRYFTHMISNTILHIRHCYFDFAGQQSKA